METARALFFQSKLPLKYWGHCVQCAVFLINRMPIKTLDNTTPYERLFNSKPDYSYLRCFGCLCFISTPKQNRSKLSQRAHPCVFLGYPAATKAYKVLDLHTNKIIITRDVVFHERNFPFHMPSVPSSATMQFFLPTHIQYEFPTDFDIPDVFSQKFSDHDNSSNTIDNTPSPPPSPPELRRSTRTVSKPSHLNDYVCNLVTFESLPSAHQALLVHSSNILELTSYAQAAKDPAWVHAMNLEIAALENSNTWNIVDLPKGKKAIGCKWIFKTKLKADGSIERHKARLVAKGFTQKYGIDYHETFSHVVKMATIRSIMSLAAHKKWDIFQLDVNNAFSSWGFT